MSRRPADLVVRVQFRLTAADFPAASARLAHVPTRSRPDVVAQLLEYGVRYEQLLKRHGLVDGAELPIDSPERQSAAPSTGKHEEANQSPQRLPAVATGDSVRLRAAPQGLEPSAAHVHVPTPSHVGAPGPRRRGLQVDAQQLNSFLTADVGK